jgi:hypothetical protein
VTFLPLDLSNPNSVENVLSHIDYAMQYGEDEEPKEVGASCLVCSPLPATLPDLMEGQAWISFHSFMEQDVKLTFSLLFTSAFVSHDRIPDCATYAPITVGTHLNLTFIMRRRTFSPRFTGAA